MSSWGWVSISRSRPPLFFGIVREERPASLPNRVGLGVWSWDRTRAKRRCIRCRRARVWPPQPRHTGGGLSPATIDTWFERLVRLRVKKAWSLILEKVGDSEKSVLRFVSYTITP